MGCCLLQQAESIDVAAMGASCSAGLEQHILGYFYEQVHIQS